VRRNRTVTQNKGNGRITNDGLNSLQGKLWVKRHISRASFEKHQEWPRMCGTTCYYRGRPTTRVLCHELVEAPRPARHGEAATVVCCTAGIIRGALLSHCGLVEPRMRYR
jgi:hypothetical protein